MAKRIQGSTPKQDGFRMPAEFEEQEQIWMLWPERPDNWRNGAKPAQDNMNTKNNQRRRLSKMSRLR